MTLAQILRFASDDAFAQILRFASDDASRHFATITVPLYLEFPTSICQICIPLSTTVLDELTPVHSIFCDEENVSSRIKAPSRLKILRDTELPSALSTLNTTFIIRRIIWG